MNKNIGLLSKGQLKDRLNEVTKKNVKKAPKRNRNGKQGVTTDSMFRTFPGSPRKTCYNCGNTNHLAIDCRKRNKKKTETHVSDVRSRAVNYKPKNPCSHCGSKWHSVYVCSEYHKLYHNNYDALPKFNKVVNSSSMNDNVKLKTTNTGVKSVYVVKADRRIFKRTQQVWVLKSSN